jgi:hypothetical protein
MKTTEVGTKISSGSRPAAGRALALLAVGSIGAVGLTPMAPRAAMASIVPLAATGATAEEAWPSTRAGELARGWVEAFDTGEPAMQKFIAEGFAPSKHAKESIDERLASYRKLREQLGSLSFARVLHEEEGVLEVGLVDADGTEQEFTFEIERDPPQKLATITARLHVKHSIFGH